MNFKTAAKIGAQISKDYAEDFFTLLVNYKDISASEAASRLGLHIRTAQDFLEGLADLDILQKSEAHEKKRPYYRYSLKTDHISIEVDLTGIVKKQEPGTLTRQIREKANAGVNFSLARGGEYISHVSLWTGKGRDRSERRISLTKPQGMFLYHLPFPNTEFLSIADIIHKAGIEDQFSPEILDIVELLEKYDVIEEPMQKTD
jgi:predicted transcriptional regulator